MRDLTQEEIDNAPEWATRYRISELNDGACYINKEKMVGMWRKNKIKFALVKGSSVFKYSKPIPRKPFDIGEYDFSDCDAVIDVAPLTNAIRVSTKSGNNAELTESDVDAMKKHFISLRSKC